MPPTPAVAARDLVKSFKGRRAVDHVTLTVAAGERVALLGPNGAGKTSTLLMLLGAVTPDSGTVEIAGLRTPMNPIRIGAVIRRHWLVLWRGPHRWFEIAFWPVMDAILWGSLGIYMSSAGGANNSVNATVVSLMLGGMTLFWTLTVVQMTVSLSVMDETNTRNLLNVLSTSLKPGEYLVGVAAFGLMKLTMTMTTITVMTTLIYGFALNTLGWNAIPILLLLIVNGWALGFVILGLVLRFGPSAEILTWGLNYVMLAISGVFFPASALPAGLGDVVRFLPTGLAFDAMRTIVRGEPAPAGTLWAAAGGSVVALVLALMFCGWMLRVFRRRGFVTRYS